MALQYDYTSIDTSSWTEQDRRNAAGFAWTMMAIDMQKVTAENWKEIFFRIKFLQKLGYGMCAVNEDASDHLIVELLVKFAGYKTNVKQEPRYKFIRRWTKALERDMEEKLKK